jgi:pimeloyl-ACP methyl ester carboxylesterase
MVQFRAAVILVSLALAAAVHAAAQDNTNKPGTPRFEDAPCPFTADERVLAQVRCGYLIVPENRAHPERRQLKLAVAIAKSMSATPRPDPVVLLSGGPGDSFLQRSQRLMDVFAGLRADRDLIIWDQRGTGYSEPAFCPDLRARYRGIAALNLPRNERIARHRQAVGECREEMLRQAVDLSQYNTLVGAQDLEDLRRVLRVGQWNLMAVSYGARLALEVMRLAPEGIRSAVLSSPLPPNPPIDARGAFADVVRRLSLACAAQPDCNAAYPDVEQGLSSGIQELEQKPFVHRPADGGPDVVINGTRFLQAVREAARSRRSLALVPMIIVEFRRRNEAVVAALTRQVSDAAGSRASRVSLGLNMTVGCHDFLTESPRTPQKATPEILDEAEFGRDESVCDALHPFRAGPQAPVVSDIPTLMFTGEFDAVTHRSYGTAASRTLRNSQVVEIPGAGHGEALTDECGHSMARGFIANPVAKVDDRCVSKVAPLRFVTDVKAIGQ